MLHKEKVLSLKYLRNFNGDSVHFWWDHNKFSKPNSYKNSDNYFHFIIML